MPTVKLVIHRIIDSNGGEINYYYDDNYNLTKVVDQSGTIISEYVYNENNRIIKSEHSNISYDSNERISEILNDNGFLSEYNYSDNSVTISMSDGKSQVVTYNYSGMVTSVTDEKSDITEYFYDDNLNLLEVTQNGVIVAEHRYTENNMLSSSTDSAGDTVRYYYDDNNRLITEKATNYCIHYVYDDNNNIICKASVKEDCLDYYNYYSYNRDNLESYDIINYTYDSNGFLCSIVDYAKNTTVSYQYDVYGNVNEKIEKETDTETITSHYSYYYDSLNRLITERTLDSETIYTYDAAGRKLLSESENSIYRIVYDNYGRVVQEIDIDDYNAECDNLPNAYQDTKVGHRYYYNEDGELVKEINKYGLETDYFYSSVGTLAQKSFDIYDYYYLINGQCDRVEVNGETKIDYDYKITDSTRELSEDQYLDKVIYANGDSEERIYDSNGMIYSIYANNGEYAYYGLSQKLSSSEQLIFYNNDSDYVYTYYLTEDNNSFERKTAITNGNKQTLFYKKSIENDVTTVDETYFTTYNHRTVYNEATVSYISENASITYSNDSRENNSSEHIRNEGDTVLSTELSYDENSQTFTKLYNQNGFLFTNTYNYKGYITSDERNNYEYDDYGELVSTTGELNSSYTYDSRGNILTKTNETASSVFTYDSTQWKDQLTSVNGVCLTYDACGNLLSYGDNQYNWSHGKRLMSVTDGDNSYTYKYDENGIRIEKAVNGLKTRFNTINGTVVSQSNGTDTLYFQYSNGSPLGFVYNGVQYMYITNISGDVVGITDLCGNLIAEYSYDEWGKLLSIETAEENNAEQMALAELNPLRYRGYYYDNETQMYYLQSRYYNPEWCRFISADDFDYIDSNSKFSINAYAYCINSPLMYSDSFGNYTTENWFEAALRVLCISIEVDAITKTFETIVKSINTTFDLNIWFNGLPEVVQKTIADFSLFLVTAINTIWVKLLDTFSLEKLEEILEGFTFDKMCQVLIDKSISDCMSMFKALFDSIENLNKGEHKPYQVVIEFATDLIFIVLPVVYPSLSPIILYIGGIFATLTEQIIFDFDNGIYIR